MSALKNLTLAWKCFPERVLCSGSLPPSTTVVRHNYTHTEFAFSRKNKPVYRALPHPKEKVPEPPKVNLPRDFMKIYRDFLPDPNMEFRNKLREKLERRDMIARRKVVDIPEFYVGSIMAVTISDPNATGKINRFVGICTDVAGVGLRSKFTLRNRIDGIGIEIEYEQYCPLVQSIEVLRLEKRLDDCLHYLRDSDPEYSTFPLDMQAELIAEDTPVPINPIKIPLLPKPWRLPYDIMDLKGVILPEVSEEEQYSTDQKKAPAVDKYDLMKEYRATITQEDQEEIFRDIAPHYPALKAAERRIRRRRIVKE